MPLPSSTVVHMCATTFELIAINVFSGINNQGLRTEFIDKINIGSSQWHLTGPIIDRIKKIPQGWSVLEGENGLN